MMVAPKELSQDSSLSFAANLFARLLVIDRHLSSSALRLLLPCTLLVTAAWGVREGVDPRDYADTLSQSGWIGPLLFVVASVALMTVLVPKTIVSIAAGAAFGLPLGGGLMVIVAVCAAYVNYWIGRHWLGGSVDHWLRQSKSARAAPWMNEIRQVAGEAGFAFHTLVRLSPVPTTLISYAMGASCSRQRPFLAAAAVAVVPQWLWVYSAGALTSVDEPSTSSLRWLSVGVSITAAVIVAWVVPRMAVMRLQTRQSFAPDGVTE